VLAWIRSSREQAVTLEPLWPCSCAPKVIQPDGERSLRYFALACDYDGTLATDGRVGDEVIGGLQAVRDSGRRRRY
jgi:hypothetical protein